VKGNYYQRALGGRAPAVAESLFIQGGLHIGQILDYLMGKKLILTLRYYRGSEAVEKHR
jgi:hypothetical protein